MTVLLLTGHHPAADRATLQALVSFQRDTPAAGLPAAPRDEVLRGLAAFQGRAATAAARPFTAREQAAFEHGFALLADAAQAQPRVALHPQLGGQGAGPLTADIARLLRQQPLDEAVELDLAVRWWQLARAAALPVEADFGECFRLIEWAWLLQQLLRSEPDPAAAKAALRYAPLKPLLLLLQPQVGAAPRAGYTF